MKVLPRHINHKSFWIDSFQLYETYEEHKDSAIYRSRHIMEVRGMEDCEKCDAKMIKYITEKYLNN